MFVSRRMVHPDWSRDITDFTHRDHIHGAQTDVDNREV